MSSSLRLNLVNMSILEKIVTQTKIDLKKRISERSLQSLESEWGYEKEIKSFSQAIRGKEVKLITEVKKASPSKGIIRENFEPVTLAKIYEDSGASAISVLTDEPFFKGHLSYMNDIAKQSNIPILRKDFIIDPYQIAEAKANGADAILLIVRILSNAQLAELLSVAKELQIDALVECYNTTDQERIDYEKVSILGVNNRDLEDFNVNVHLGVSQLKMAPESTVTVSESGISTVEDIKYLQQNGIHAVLIGEHLMRQSNVGEELKKLVIAAQEAADMPNTSP
jgi:indole-3-glycerol phosphate synthase